MQDKGLKVYGLLLCAGLSGRMGSFKPLLEFNKKSFLENIVLNLSPVCDKIVLVTGYKHREIENVVNNKFDKPLKDKVNLVFNDHYESGMFSSLQRGMRNTLQADWVLYHFIDQPNLRKEFYTEFINQIDAKWDWIQPEYKGRKGHPLLLSRSAVELILESKEDQSLRDISPKIRNKKIWSCNHLEILTDIDTPEEYSDFINANLEQKT